MPEHIDSESCGCWGCIEEFEVRSVARDSLGLLAKDRARVDLVPTGSLGATSPPVEMSLLAQLKMAAESKGSERGAAGAVRSGVPVDLVALELLGTIARELHWDAIELLACDPYADEDPVSDALALLGRVDQLPGEVLAVRVPRWRQWVVQIQAYLAPERRTPVPGLCPAPGCGELEWFTYDDEGARVASSALVALWEGEQVQSVMCNCCYSVWARHQLWELSGALGAGFSSRVLAP